MSAKFTISVVTFNQLELAKKCIWSVLENSGEDCRIIVTVNGNTESAKWFHKMATLDDSVEVVVNATNEGFIIPNIRALAMADSEFFIMVNDDCQPPPGWLEMLEAPFLSDPKCGLSGPKGGQFRPGKRTDAVEWIEGSCLMGRTALLKEAGLFSDYLTFATWEEIDLGFRLMAKGYTLHLTPFPINHVGKATRRYVKDMAWTERKNRYEVQKRFPQYFRP